MEQIKEKILVVDDDDIQITLLHYILDEYFEVISTTKPTEVLKLLEKNDIHLIISDVKMPRIDGFELIKKIKEKEEYYKIPFLFVSGAKSEEEEIKGLRLGALDFIPKPYNKDIVLIKTMKHLENYKQLKFFEKNSRMDSLTSICNRRVYDEEIERNFNYAKMHKHQISLLMLDIDYFKQYNDIYGHGKGDQCLIEIATTIKGIKKRDTDIFARYGGEEFALILPDSTEESAIKIADKILKEIKNKKIPHNGSIVSKNVSISIGIVSIIPIEDTTIEDFQKMADDKLYEAKRNGRNRLEI